MRFRISPSTSSSNFLFPPPSPSSVLIPSTIPSSSWWFITKAYLLLHPFQRAKSTGVACIAHDPPAFFGSALGIFENLVTQKNCGLRLPVALTLETPWKIGAPFQETIWWIVDEDVGRSISRHRLYPKWRCLTTRRPLCQMDGQRVCVCIVNIGIPSEIRSGRGIIDAVARKGNRIWKVNFEKGWIWRGICRVDRCFQDSMGME